MKGETGGVAQRKCEISVSPRLWPSVCFCGYLPLHCLFAGSEATCWEGGGTREGTNVNK